ncbi:MAG: response regulator [Nitrospirae bacterium]|nr:MAG: response regulator [Nitrospirota bacterium]
MATQALAPTILVVDDDPKWLRVVSLYLSARAYRVMTAPDGDGALRMVAEEPPDIVIADIAMPGLNGFELCSRLRRDPATKTIPFIFLTGLDRAMDRVKARKVGSDDYLTKPCPLERLAQSVEQLIDRVQLARQVPLEEIGPSGRIEDVDLLDLIQTLELQQRTGGLVLSHGERTATLYFQEGVIVDADIRSPKREEPLFILLGWKTGRFLFLPGATPDRLPITASLANLLLRDLLALEAHEHTAAHVPVQDKADGTDQPSGLARQVVERLDAIAARQLADRAPFETQPIVPLRILVAGVRRSGKSEVIHHLVKTLSPSRWASIGIEEPKPTYRTDVGRVRISASTVLHLVALRIEARFWPLWEQCLPGATGVILLANPDSEEVRRHLVVFLRSRTSLAPRTPIQALVPEGSSLHSFAGLQASAEITTGSPHDPLARLTALDRLLQRQTGATLKGGPASPPS